MNARNIQPRSAASTTRRKALSSRARSVCTRAVAGVLLVSAPALAVQSTVLDDQLVQALQAAGFTGTVEASLETRLGRPLDSDKVRLGRLLFFDDALGLHEDNSCAGCHAPANGFGDSQRIAIGVDNNGVVGDGRTGPRNQRRSPSVVNTEFYPALMWTARFKAVSGDPFDNSLGFLFPAPEGLITTTETLLQAQGSLPATELVEMAGFNGVTANPGPTGPDHLQFDDADGDPLPAPDATGFHNFPIQALIDARLNGIPAYLELFGQAFNGGVALPPGGITIDMRREALAEFQMSLPGADAPLDRFARGEHAGMDRAQKHGALLFFGKANCVSCHAVAGGANEMFSDFELHHVAGPQVFPQFGLGLGNVIFDGAGRDEDFGALQTSGVPADRYAFRTAPLRNLAVAKGFFHNGAFGSIEAAIRHHVDVVASAAGYDPGANALPADLAVGPIAPVLAQGIDPLLATPLALSQSEIRLIARFLEHGLLDERVRDFCSLVPASVPSGLPVADFEGCGP